MSVGYRSIVRPLAWAGLAAGAFALVYAAARLPLARLDVSFLLLSLITVNVGTRILLRIPKVDGHVSLADAFVFLVMLLFGGEAGVVLAAVAALFAPLGAGRKRASLLFDAAAAAASALVAVWLIRFCVGALTELRGGASYLGLIVAVGIMALMQFAFHTVTRTARNAQRADIKSHFWTLVTCLTMATAAGVAAKFVGAFGLYAFLVAATALAIVHFAYLAHLREPDAVEGAQMDVDAHRSVTPESQELFRRAFDYAAVGMGMVSKEGRWIRVNHALCEILGYSPEELLATDFQHVTHPEDLGSALSNVRELLRGDISTCQLEKRYVHKRGHSIWVLWSVARVSDAQTGAVHLIFQVQDNTDRKRAEERLLHDAFHDALTGLPNRALFTDHLKLTIARTQRHAGHMYAVLFLDLDRFKIINDSLGHMIGDQLLVGIARRLETCLRQGDTVARVGGDEFTILLEDVKDEIEPINVAERIQKELTVPFTLGGREVFTTASIGIAPSSTGYDKPEDILRDADTAMYRAKSLGKARHEIFDKAMHAVAMNLLQLETDMRRALERKEFFIQYQPIVSLDTFNLRGFEALVRWQHPERGFISPMDFIPVAEDTGQIIPIGGWVLKEACQQMCAWQKRFVTEQPLFISVNLSSRQFTQPDLIAQVSRTLDETKLSPRSLKLEITESAVMEDIDQATEMLRQLRGLGVQLSIDDFGTGYSSLSYLHRFPIDTLKIDRSFVIRMVDNNENIEIVRTIVMLAQTLGMDVVAEGVETKEQLALLRAARLRKRAGLLFFKAAGRRGRRESHLRHLYASAVIPAARAGATATRQSVHGNHPTGFVDLILRWEENEEYQDGSASN